MRAMFLRHEGFLGALGAFLSYNDEAGPLLQGSTSSQFVERFPMGAPFAGGEVHGPPIKDLNEKVRTLSCDFVCRLLHRRPLEVCRGLPLISVFARWQRNVLRSNGQSMTGTCRKPAPADGAGGDGRLQNGIVCCLVRVDDICRGCAACRSRGWRSSCARAAASPHPPRRRSRRPTCRAPRRGPACTSASCTSTPASSPSPSSTNDKREHRHRHCHRERPTASAGCHRDPCVSDRCVSLCSMAQPATGAHHDGGADQHTPPQKAALAIAPVVCRACRGCVLTRACLSPCRSYEPNTFDMADPEERE